MPFPNPNTQFGKPGGNKVFGDPVKAGQGNKNNPKSIIAAKIRYMRQKGELSDEDLDYLEAMFSDPLVSAFDMYAKLEEAYKAGDISVKDFLNFKDRYHRTVHGDKINITKQSLNINIEMNSDEIEDLEKFITQKEKP